jgi:hypothetical protein
MDSSAQVEPAVQDLEQDQEHCREQGPEELVLCAGLPFTGTRPLTEADRVILRAQRVRAQVAGAAWLLAILLAPAFIISTWALIARARSAAPFEFAAISFAILLFLGIPVALLKARDQFRRARVCGKTIRSTFLRSFSGALNIDDPSDRIRESLIRSGLLNIQDEGVNCIELHSSADAVYRINHVTPQRHTAVELTRAASAPLNPAKFTVPPDWAAPVERAELSRRRLTAGEKAELRNYANEVGTRTAFAVVLVCWFGGKMLWQVLSRLLADWPGLGETLSVAIVIGVCVQLILRARDRAGQLYVESENGWAVGIEPSESASYPQNSPNPVIPSEVLSFSGTLWTVRGRPAGWRRAKIS